jgi:hypothetical protein
MRQDNKDAVDKRKRIIEWQDPGAVREQADGLSVLDIMRGIRDGTLPPPPIARLIGFRYIEAEPGQTAIELQPEQPLRTHPGHFMERQRAPCWIRRCPLRSVRFCPQTKELQRSI